MQLFLIGIGTGNPDHVTLQGVAAMAGTDLVLVPRKGPAKEDLAEVRHLILSRHAPDVPVAEFDMPARDPAINDYAARVDAWHDEIASRWADAIAAYPAAAKVALLVWGDPSLYDSTLRIAARLTPAPLVKVIPGITAIQALAAAHAIPLNTVNGPFLITTGRQIRDHGWPEAQETVIVMLDGECSFQHLDPKGIHIWWGAYLGMAEETLHQGPLSEAGPRILATRAAARVAHGWIMDIYLMRKQA
jgi:precorrin-6A synthase